ncbi:MAG: L-serine ammonia-lyase, partial [Bryobacteraceae bacterium]
MQTSLFDLFRIGIGPSSSHTVGPMRAAREFAGWLKERDLLQSTAEIITELYGSLALTGRGHGTDRAVLLGFCGESPETVDPTLVDSIAARIRADRRLPLLNQNRIAFDEPVDLIFRTETLIGEHPNAMRFTALDSARRQLASRVYYSTGGGFIRSEEETGNGDTAGPTRRTVPYPFHSGSELLRMAKDCGLPIWKLMLENEKAWRPEDEVLARISCVWQVMRECTERGMKAEGVLPGGLNVCRRAPGLVRELKAKQSSDPFTVMDWLNTFAMAVAEENAVGGRVVTAPTNGAAGVVPAVAHYYTRFLPEACDQGVIRYFLSAAAIGILYKENASISGAEVGCQGEIGVACSMAAAGLVAALEGTNEQVEHAAEIAMEHHLGMTCDPIGGLVQIPCIERNAFGAVMAVNAARMAIAET